MLLQGANRYPVREIVLHCAAVKSGWAFRMSNAEIVPEIRKWHVQRGWRDIGYHYVIAPDGAILTGRPADYIGAGVVGHNRGVMHVLMIERAEIRSMGKFDDFFNEKQRDAVRSLARTYDITEIRGHNDYAPKLCPGFKVKQAFFL